MDKLALTEIFDSARIRTKQTVAPVKGHFEKLPNVFYYKFKLETTDLTSYQEYYDGDHNIGSIFDFTDDEKNELRKFVDFEFTNANAFYVAPNTMIHPHIDNSPKRSQRSTILHLSGIGSILRLHDGHGNTIFELPEVVDRYTLYPSKVIHSYEVKNEEAKFINFWHD